MIQANEPLNHLSMMFDFYKFSEDLQTMKIKTKWQFYGKFFQCFEEPPTNKPITFTHIPELVCGS